MSSSIHKIRRTIPKKLILAIGKRPVDGSSGARCELNKFGHFQVKTEKRKIPESSDEEYDRDCQHLGRWNHLGDCRWNVGRGGAIPAATDSSDGSHLDVPGGFGGHDQAAVGGCLRSVGQGRQGQARGGGQRWSRFPVNGPTSHAWCVELFWTVPVRREAPLNENCPLKYKEGESQPANNIFNNDASGRIWMEFAHWTCCWSTDDLHKNRG